MGISCGRLENKEETCHRRLSCVWPPEVLNSMSYGMPTEVHRTPGS